MTEQTITCGGCSGMPTALARTGKSNPLKEPARRLMTSMVELVSATGNQSLKDTGLGKSDLTTALHQFGLKSHSHPELRQRFSHLLDHLGTFFAKSLPLSRADQEREKPIILDQLYPALRDALNDPQACSALVIHPLKKELDEGKDVKVETNVARTATLFFTEPEKRGGKRESIDFNLTWNPGSRTITDFQVTRFPASIGSSQVFNSNEFPETSSLIKTLQTLAEKDINAESLAEPLTNP